MRHASLTGAWSGAYRFPGDALPETVFNVAITEVAGAFTGALQEPNILQRGPGSVVTADIEGVREGRSVSFTKFYDGSGEMNHAVRYEGEADEGLTRVDGRWRIPGDWSGTFFMVRDDAGETAQAEERAEAEIEVSR